MKFEFALTSLKTSEGPCFPQFSPEAGRWGGGARRPLQAQCGLPRVILTELGPHGRAAGLNGTSQNKAGCMCRRWYPPDLLLPVT